MGTVVENVLRGRRAYLVLGVLILVLYGRSMFFDITILDDNLMVDSARAIAGHPDIIGQIFTQHQFGEYYRPMLAASFVLDALIAGDSLLLFHLTNILYHMAGTLLLFLFLKRLKYERFLAFWAAAVFAVHPVLAQAVGWLPGRNDSLVTILILGSLISLDRFRKEKEWEWLAAHLFLFFGAVFTKESAVMLPILSILYLIWFREKESTLRRQLKIIAPLGVAWSVMIAIFLVCRRLAFSKMVGFSFPMIVKMIWSDMPGLLLYLGKIFWPFNLSVFPSLQDSRLYPGLISLILLGMALLLIKQTRRRYWLFGLIWFVLFLLPTFIHPSLINPPVFLEHRLYLPLIGIIIVVLEILRPGTRFFLKKTGQAGLLILIAVLMTINFKYSVNFKNKALFWNNAVTNSPHHPMAHLNLAAVYYLEGNDAAALDENFKAIDLHHSETAAHNNIALIYEGQGDFEKAKAYFEQEIKLNPKYATAYFNYGLLLFREENPAEAIRCWEKTIALDPDYCEAYYNLAVAYDRLEDKEKSAYYLYQYKIKPGCSECP